MTKTGTSIPPHPGYRLRSGQIPGPYLLDEYPEGKAGWWLEGVDLEADFDNTGGSALWWHKSDGVPDEGDAQFWAKTFIPKVSMFQVTGWDAHTDDTGRYFTPRLTVTRHTLTIWEIGDPDSVRKHTTLDRHVVTRITNQLNDSDGVIRLHQPDDRITYVPVRAVASLDHSWEVLDVPPATDEVPW